MAQHDYNIANQTAPNFRSDLNNALNAIVTTNASTTPLSTTFGCMLWYDATNNTIKMRNEANTGWISLMTLDQVSSLSWPTNIASQAEAEAGTNATKMMTPQRVAQTIDALAPSFTMYSAGGVDTTSGTAVDFTSIPSGTKLIHIQFQAVKLSGTDNILVQIGASGGIETSGYAGGSSRLTSSVTTVSNTSGYLIPVNSTVHALVGTMTLVLADSVSPTAHRWIQSHSLRLDGSTMAVGGGTKVISGELDRIRLTVTGSNTFNGGEANLLYI